MTETEQEQWKAIRTGLAESRGRIAEMQDVYCLTPAETERLIQYAAGTIASNQPSAQRRAQLAQQLEKLFRQLIKQGLVPQDDVPKEPKEPKEPRGKDAPPTKDEKAKEKK
jgi:hypothetical protein